MKNIFLIIVLFWAITSEAQVKGLVFTKNPVDNKKEPIAYAQIEAINNGIFYADENGSFQYIVSKNWPDTLVISSLGYLTDTLILTNKDRFAGYEIEMFEENKLSDVVITARKQTHGISRMDALQVEHLGQGELRKAACCNLSESFETNVSVDVNFTDAVTGIKQIQMLGLEGYYSQIQFENVPALRGLESPFGLNSVPGTWVNSIQITKGAGNVVNGYESMAGLINVEFLNGEAMPPLFLNIYGNAFGRFEANVQSGLAVGKKKKWTTGIFAHYSENFLEMDQNKDGFRDLPVGRLLSAMNRWNYTGEKFEVKLTARAFNEHKFGGQTDAYPRNFATKYGTELSQSGIEFTSKTGFLFKQMYRSLGLILNYKYHDLNFDLSNANFTGFQNRAYGNLVYDDILGNTNHKYRTGLSFVYDDFKQNLWQKTNQFVDNRTDVVPGAFFEYTFTSTRFTGVAGLRYDYHNRFKSQLSPRLHGKFILTENTDLRFTAGRGWRTPNYITDNLFLLASSRDWLVNSTLQPEISWNAGGSLVQRFKLFNRSASIVADYYYTNFVKQLIADRDVQSNLVVFKNLDGQSFSHAAQIEFEMEPVKSFVIRLAYKYLDVKAEYGSKMQQQALVPKHRGFINLAYQTRNKQWQFDVTGNVFGNSRLPVYNGTQGMVVDSYSPVYPMLNGQITYIYKDWDFYVGAENITNYRQKNPIIDAQNPFGSKFDATQVWGPIMGTNVYLGVRFTLKKKNTNTENHLNHENH